MKAYKTIILDVDGVLFDSNKLKQDNIREAARDFCSIEKLEEFVTYFVLNNGLPREVKINSTFGENSAASLEILKRYNELNRKSLIHVPMTPGAEKFLKEHSLRCKLWALSGGAENEVKDLFYRHDIAQYFEGIYGGPVSKKVHIRQLPIEKPCIYIGDSKIDYETAGLVGVDFVFMNRYTQFDGWAEYFSDKPEVRIISDLTQFNNISNN